MDEDEKSRWVIPAQVSRGSLSARIVRTSGGIDSRLPAQRDDDAVRDAECAENGQVIAECRPRHRHQEFLRFLRRLDRELPKELNPH